MYISSLEFCISSLEIEISYYIHSFFQGLWRLFPRANDVFRKEKAAVWSIVPGGSLLLITLQGLCLFCSKVFCVELVSHILRIVHIYVDAVAACLERDIASIT